MEIRNSANFVVDLFLIKMVFSLAPAGVCVVADGDMFPKLRTLAWPGLPVRLKAESTL